MPTILHVAREEIRYHTQFWTFYIVTFGIPLIFAAMGAIPRLQTFAEETSLPEVETIFNLDIDLTLETPVGYVDHGNLMQTMVVTNFYQYENEAAAEEALVKGNIESYYVIASDYLTSGQVVQYSNVPQLLTESDFPVRRIFQEALLQRLDSPTLTARLRNPVDLVLRGPPPRPLSFLDEQVDWNVLLAAGLLIGLFSYTLSSSGALMVRSLQREVKVRVLEILITSTSTSQFIGGKMLGLASLALSQVSLSLLAALWVYGNNPDGSGPAALPLSGVLICLPYLGLGLLAYCGIVMSMASLWPNPKESGSLLSIAQLFGMSPMLLVPFMLPDMDSWFTMFLSLFPPFTPLLMTFRILLVPVPPWQLVVGLMGLSLWAGFTVSLSIRLFRARSLMTGQSLLPRLIDRFRSRRSHSVTVN